MYPNTTRTVSTRYFAQGCNMDVNNPFRPYGEWRDLTAGIIDETDCWDLLKKIKKTEMGYTEFRVILRQETRVETLSLKRPRRMSAAMLQRMEEREEARSMDEEEEEGYGEEGYGEDCRPILERGTLDCPKCKKPLHFENIGSIFRTVRDGHYNARCVHHNEDYKVIADKPLY